MGPDSGSWGLDPQPRTMLGGGALRGLRGRLAPPGLLSAGSPRRAAAGGRGRAAPRRPHCPRRRRGWRPRRRSEPGGPWTARRGGAGRWRRTGSQDNRPPAGLRCPAERSEPGSGDPAGTRSGQGHCNSDLGAARGVPSRERDARVLRKVESWYWAEGAWERGPGGGPASACPLHLPLPPSAARLRAPGSPSLARGRESFPL